MDTAALQKIIKSKFDDVITKKAYGETTFFYNPKRMLPNGVYFTTIKEADGPNDKSSNLSREGVFRLSFKPFPSTYKSLFGEKPARPRKGEIVALDFDFSIQNTLLPHPIYAWMGWIMILNPRDSQVDSVLRFLNESYSQAKLRFEKQSK